MKINTIDIWLKSDQPINEEKIISTNDKDHLMTAIKYINIQKNIIIKKWELKKKLENENSDPNVREYLDKNDNYVRVRRNVFEALVPRSNRIIHEQKIRKKELIWDKYFNPGDECRFLLKTMQIHPMIEHSITKFYPLIN